ncbi:hypothetical protein BH10BAC5_BH10BAC5_02280 [soil metagenome]
MQKHFNNLFLTPVILSVIICIAGCNKKDEPITIKTETKTESKIDSVMKQAIYVCPMHPEVTSLNKDEKCPKCGMNLVEKTDEGKDGSAVKLHSDKYNLDLTTEPKELNAGEEITLNFKLTDTEKKQTIKDFDIVHEKIVHLIIVSKNLSYFDHIHPELKPDGSLTVKTKFTKGGEYVLFADLTPKGEKHSQVFNIPIMVKGDAVQNVTLTPRNTFSVDGYTVELTTDPSQLVTNKATEFVVKVQKDGKDVTNLQNYLGALGHMVVISEDASLYLHVHPMEAGASGHDMGNMKMDMSKVTKSGPTVVFHTNFPKTGTYKVFAQFNPGGKLITTNFVINVK